MQGEKYFWQNDYLHSTSEPEDNIYQRDILLHPSLEVINQYQFSEENLIPIIMKIISHIELNHKIAICGDYDVDGITSTVILLKILHLLNANVQYYIPNRFEDGYGINENIVDNFLADDVKLIITVDNGIVANDAVVYAQELGGDVIVTDHHTPGETRPQTPFILHPQLDEQLKSCDVCGAAVAFLLGKALLKHVQIEDKALEEELLQLACLGTIADMMPLNQTFNRCLSWLGFEQIQKKPLLLLEGITKLLKIEKFTSDSLGFQIIPCLNAVGRLADANVVVEAFMTDSLSECLVYLEEFIALNTQRKNMTQTLVEEIETIFLTDETIEQEKGFLLAYGSNWHQGILGIAAQRLMQKFQRPVILLTTTETDETVYTGSARAFGAYNVKGCFDFLAPVLVKHGGHQHAGGLSVLYDKLPELEKLLVTYNHEIAKSYSDEDVQMSLTIDGWLSFIKLNNTFLQYQEQFAPFGEGNKKFNIGVKQVKIVDIQELGKTKQHVKLTVSENNKKYQIVAFQMYSLLTKIAKYSAVDVVIECQRNYYNGVERLQYLLVDIRTQEKQLFDFRNMQYQKVEMLASQECLYIKEIPLDVQTFFAEIKGQEIRRIYLHPFEFENQLLYAETIDKKYFDYIYKYIYTKGKLDLTKKEMYQELYQKKIPKSVFLYVIQVFFELDFVIIEDNICQITKSVKKSVLANSLHYQNLQEWLIIRNLLLTGSVDSLYEKLLQE